MTSRQPVANAHSVAASLAAEREGAATLAAEGLASLMRLERLAGLSCERTVTTRCAIVTSPSAPSSHRAAGRMYGTPKPVSRTAIAATIRRSARSAMPTLAVAPTASARALAYEVTWPGDEREGRGRGEPRLVLEGAIQRKAAEDGAITDPVQGRVEEVAPWSGRAGHPCHRAIEQVAERQHEEQEDCGHEPALRQEGQGDHDHADRSRDGDGVG